MQKKLTIDDFSQPIPGLYRYILGAKVCYEIVVIRSKLFHSIDNDDYVVGYLSGWRYNKNTNESCFERECITGSQMVKLSTALDLINHDYLENF